jgi:sulfatase maturation enzyme AslB (radical SAM superfamily)
LAIKKDSSAEPHLIQSTQDFEPVWNSYSMKAIRLNMLKGVWPRECLTCKSIEETGGESLRMSELKNSSNRIIELINSTSLDGSVSAPITHIDMKPGNTCNLSCSMCAPMFSKKTIKDKLAIYPEKTEADFKEFLELNWHEDEDFWDKLLEKAPQARRFHFAGGEPLLNNHLIRFLQKLSESPQASEVQLSFATNLTILPEKLLSVLGSFGKCSFYVSLDGTKEINTYIRYPSEFDAVISNIQKLHENRKELSIDFVLIHSVIQSFNIFDTSALCRFIDKEFPSLAADHVLFPLDSPIEFNCQQLPEGCKEEAEADLRAYLTELNLSDADELTKKNRKTAIEGIISFMNAKKSQATFADKFRYTAKVYDSLRGMKIGQLEPRLSPAL